VPSLGRRWPAAVEPRRRSAISDGELASLPPWLRLWVR
jgi:hypothetical protein